MKSKMSIPGIIGALVLVAGAYFYNQKKADSYELPAEWEAAQGVTVQYSYVHRLPDRNGGYKVVDCYTIQPFQNKAGETVEPGCVKDYKMKAICEKANCLQVER
ncbi:MAG: hypothetical protein CMN76_17600 [Spirochaetaceae bacterium]|nr:hypothetical protein [Spirochaetaceae bacterium]|tara:strand:- start:39810 stop:40121 length:312 start_codon:yes stop_codon:yes gene_type:complete